MARHGVGILGYGGFGQFLHDSWSKLSEVNIVAVADQLASRKPAPPVRFYNDWKDLANDDEVEIVAICTPPVSHAQIAISLMQAGKSVLVEKPLAITPQDAEKIIHTRDKTGKVATVNYMLRFNPLIETLSGLAKDNVFGSFRHYNLENYAQDQGLPPEHWFWNKEISGGILIEHAVHFIDMVHSFTHQNIKAVTGFGHNRNPKQQDQVLGSILYDGGLIATHYHSFARPGFFENTSMRFNFDLAQIDIEGWIPLTGRITALLNSDNIEKLHLLPGFKVVYEKNVDELPDTSRPKEKTIETTNDTRRNIRSGGVDYHVSKQIIGSFNIGIDKQKVYAGCVQAMIKDIVKKIENPSQNLRVTLEDGLKSLQAAYTADKFADNPPLE